MYPKYKEGHGRMVLLLKYILLSGVLGANSMGAAQSRSGCSQIPTVQPALQRRKQRGRHLQLQHTTQLLIYADQTSLTLIFARKCARDVKLKIGWLAGRGRLMLSGRPCPSFGPKTCPIFLCPIELTHWCANWYLRCSRTFPGGCRGRWDCQPWPFCLLYKDRSGRWGSLHCFE